MNTLLKGLLSAVIATLKSHLGTALTQYVTDAVARLSESPGTGEDKKALLLAGLDAEDGQAGRQYTMASRWLVNLLIESVVARIRL